MNTDDELFWSSIQKHLAPWETVSDPTTVSVYEHQHQHQSLAIRSVNSSPPSIVRATTPTFPIHHLRLLAHHKPPLSHYPPHLTKSPSTSYHLKPQTRPRDPPPLLPSSSSPSPLNSTSLYPISTAPHPLPTTNSNTTPTNAPTSLPDTSPLIPGNTKMSNVTSPMCTGMPPSLGYLRGQKWARRACRSVSRKGRRVAGQCRP